jgi:lipopolysaccharide export system permease protein
MPPRSAGRTTTENPCRQTGGDGRLRVRTTMKLNSILNRYIFKELFAPFAINVVFFTFVFLMAQMLKITDLIVNYSVGLFSILKILLFSIPYFLMYVVPMSVMLAVLLTFLRMNGDNEIIAMKTGGISLYRMLPPVLLFCLGACALAFYMSAFGAPASKQAIKDLTFTIFSQNLDIGLKERTFNDSFQGVMLYVNEVDSKNKLLVNVFIEDKREKDMVTTVVAPRGKLFSEAGNLVYHLRLFDGRINQVSIEKRSAQSITFDTYDIRLDLSKALETVENRAKRWKEMTLVELHRFLRAEAGGEASLVKPRIRFHGIIAMPFACFALGILAVPLGIQPKSTRRSIGLVVGVLFFLLYYLVLSAGHVFGETGRLSPALAMWTPNIVMGSLGGFLLLRSAQERPVRLAAPLQALWRLVNRIGRRGA